MCSTVVFSSSVIVLYPFQLSINRFLHRDVLVFSATVPDSDVLVFSVTVPDSDVLVLYFFLYISISANRQMHFLLLLEFLFHDETVTNASITWLLLVEFFRHWLDKLQGEDSS